MQNGIQLGESTAVNETRRRLIPIGSDDTVGKPTELVGETITILASSAQVTRDGRTAYKWMVERANGDTGIYWGAGTNPCMWVDVWFRKFPGVPLRCRIWQQTNEFGTAQWHIEQIDEELESQAQGPAKESVDDQLTHAGLFG